MVAGLFFRLSSHPIHQIICFRWWLCGGSICSPCQVKHVSANSRYNVISFDQKELRVVFEVFDEEDTGSITADKVRWCECFLMVDKVEDHLASQFFFVNLKVYCFSGVVCVRSFQTPVSLRKLVLPNFNNALPISKASGSCFPIVWIQMFMASIRGIRFWTWSAWSMWVPLRRTCVPYFQTTPGESPRFRHSYWWSSLPFCGACWCLMPELEHLEQKIAGTNWTNHIVSFQIPKCLCPWDKKWCAKVERRDIFDGFGPENGEDI